MESIIIKARNNLDKPIRLTLSNSSDGTNSQILITVGHEGVKLSDYYRVCIDADLPLMKEWQEIGSLNMDTKIHATINGKQSEPSA